MGPFSDGWTVEQVEALMGDPNAADLLYVPIVVSQNSSDFLWADSVCEELSNHPNPQVRGNAILGFGHLARRHRRCSSRARQLVAEALNDLDPYVRGHAESAIDDFQTFLDRAG